MSKEGEPDSWGILDHERMIKGNLSQSGLKFRLLLDDRMTLRTFPCSFRSYKVTSSYDICRTFDNVLKQAIIYFILWEKLQRTIHHQLHKAVLCKEKGKLIARENAPKNPYESFVKVIQSTKQKNFRKVVCTTSTAKSTYDLPCGGTKYYPTFFILELVWI